MWGWHAACVENRLVQSSTTSGDLVLQLATKNQVHSFDLSEVFRVAIGRHHSNDVELRSKRVSNYHAEILNEVEGLILRDLGSTNGTYVNGESARRHRLQTGDRLTIGNFELTVRLVPRGASASSGGAGDEFAVGTMGNILPFERGAESADGSPQGRDRSLPELLMGLAGNGSSVMVIIRNQSDAGRIYFDGGRIIHCENGAARREKALYRLLKFKKGTYEIFAFPDDGNVPETIAGQTEALVIDGLQQLELMERLSSQLPPMVYEIGLNEDCAVAVNTMTPEELEIYVLLVRYQTILRVLEESPLPDFTVLQVIHRLLAKRFFQPLRSTGGLLEETTFSRPEVG